jgi:lipopolysaccharide/colanic/teichoic acid biosynthesis glycosyltransferase
MVNLRVKRFFDFLISFNGLLVLTPFFIVIGLAIKLYDKGPVFFRQKRMGRGGIPFYVFKFRTMHDLESSSEGSFEPGNVSRVTSLGKFLRNTKLNELPQLINVLIGDMSIVGPRPEVEKWVAVYSDRWEKVLKVKPGITDKASIVFMNEESILSESYDPEVFYEEVILPRKLDLYEEYVQNNSFSGDIRLILSTLSCLIRKKKLVKASLLAKNSESIAS